MAAVKSQRSDLPWTTTIYPSMIASVAVIHCK